ncbi:hypothetical protein ACEWY4_020611 [Coilia grayii]|uniref:Coiled-coil domain-containing protein 106 n=1 Tax=Coilia grayii TaxID=363190 RepID=A0ABD1J6L6_9TELE
METRRKRMKMEAEEGLALSVTDIVEEQLEEVVLEEPKKKKMAKSKHNVSPTGLLMVSNLKQQRKLDEQKIQLLEEKIQYLEEANKELKRDKDFLLSQIHVGAVKASPSAASTSGSSKPLVISSFSSSSPSSSLSLSEEEEKKMKKKKKKKKTKSSPSRSRMTTIDGVIRRYQAVLKHFTKLGSMKRAFSKVHVDRNTIARTAVIAELAIVAPQKFQELLSRHEDTETISTFAEKCLATISPELGEEISKEKKKGKLLPIAYKYT